MHHQHHHEAEMTRPKGSLGYKYDMRAYFDRLT